MSPGPAKVLDKAVTQDEYKSEEFGWDVEAILDDIGGLGILLINSNIFRKSSKRSPFGFTNRVPNIDYDIVSCEQRNIFFA